MHNLKYWRKWIKSYHDKSINYSLDNVKLIAADLSVDKFSVPVITVAGTNGKGSCIATMEALLQAHGFSTGVYVSPHMFDFTERIRLNSQPVNEIELCNAMQAVHDIIAQRDYLKLSYFEFATMAALLIFKQHQPDYILLEVGLGGRLDAVNVVANQLAVITSISLDHCAILGDSIEAIAGEKAGIIKHNVQAVYGAHDMPNSVRQQAQTQQAHLTQLGVEYNFIEYADHWQWRSPTQEYLQLPLPSFPIQNAATALQALSLLPNMKLNSRIVAEGFANLRVIGRFQVEKLNGREYIFDVAHNPAAVNWLVKKLHNLPCQGKALAIVAIVATKDSAAMFKEWQYPIVKWFSCEPASMRNPSPVEKLLEEIAATQTGTRQAVANVAMALNLAQQQTEVGDRIVIFGSFHTVAEALDEFYRMK